MCIRDRCDNVITKAEQVCNKWGVSITKRIRKKHMIPEDYADDSALTVQQEMRCSLMEILDKLSVEISSHFSNIKELEKRFGFHCKFKAYINDGAVSYTHLSMALYNFIMDSFLALSLIHI